MFVEKGYAPVEELTLMANSTPTGLRGQQLIDFNAARRKSRDLLKTIREILLLDEATDG